MKTILEYAESKPPFTFLPGTPPKDKQAFLPMPLQVAP
jgi:hypothetical protein